MWTTALFCLTVIIYGVVQSHADRELNCFFWIILIYKFSRYHYLGIAWIFTFYSNQSSSVFQFREGTGIYLYIDRQLREKCFCKKEKKKGHDILWVFFHDILVRCSEEGIWLNRHNKMLMTSNHSPLVSFLYTHLHVQRETC